MIFPLTQPFVVTMLRETTGVRTAIELENNFSAPVHHVTILGGTDDTFLVDRPLVDIDTYGSSLIEGEQLAQEARSALYSAIGEIYNGAVLTRVVTSVAPRWIPTDRTDVRRFGATYQLSVHNA